MTEMPSITIDEYNKLEKSGVIEKMKKLIEERIIRISSNMGISKVTELGPSPMTFAWPAFQHDKQQIKGFYQEAIMQQQSIEEESAQMKKLLSEEDYQKWLDGDLELALQSEDQVPTGGAMRCYAGVDPAGKEPESTWTPWDSHGCDPKKDLQAMANSMLSPSFALPSEDKIQIPGTTEIGSKELKSTQVYRTGVEHTGVGVEWKRGYNAVRQQAIPEAAQRSGMYLKANRDCDKLRRALNVVEYYYEQLGMKPHYDNMFLSGFWIPGEYTAYLYLTLTESISEEVVSFIVEINEGYIVQSESGHYRDLVHPLDKPGMIPRITSAVERNTEAALKYFEKDIDELKKREFNREPVHREPDAK